MSSIPCFINLANQRGGANSQRVFQRGSPASVPTSLSSLSPLSSALGLSPSFSLSLQTLSSLQPSTVQRLSAFRLAPDQTPGLVGHLGLMKMRAMCAVFMIRGQQGVHGQFCYRILWRQAVQM